MVDAVWVENLARTANFPFSDFGRSGSCAAQGAARSTHRRLYARLGEPGVKL